ncbi:Phosphoserine phosphatase [hydrothermal vent metagenome]|uniref:Phosphoserine phosphatase n=1 Tax=hydrothermal vent metagenome TaxID=652676 RepID=A0A3B0SDW5_9ZZZZ
MAGTAIFDLDRTITRAPTWTWFLLHVNGKKPLFWGQLTLIILRMVAYKLRLVPRTSIKEAGIKTLKTHDRAQLQTKADAFVANILKTGLRPGAVAAINAHKTQGDRLILVTAAVDVVAKPLAHALGFDQVISTRLTWPAGASGPVLDGANCYGAEKQRRMAQAEAAQPFAHPIYAYSDHISDLELLAQADHAIAVNPSSALRRAALTHGFEIVDFDTPPSLSDKQDQSQ